MKYLFLLIISFNTFASVSEFFGASAHNIMNGNQFYSVDDAANNYYNPAILSFSNKNLISFSNLAIKTNFNEINNVIIENKLNNNSTPEVTGNADVDYPTSTLMNLHLAMNLFKNFKLGVSFYSPLTKVVSASTGDPYAPEYVMYKSRYNRLLLSANVAYKYSNTLAFSIGLTNGLRTEGEAYLISPPNTSPYSSNGKIKFDVTPTVGLIFSMAKRFESNDLFLLTFHQEIKSEFENRAYGKTPLAGGGADFPFNINMNSMLFYDPHILRATYVKYFNKKLTITSTLEYQIWTGYEAPTLKFDSISGFASTESYGNESISNILIPKIAMTYSISEETSFSLGGYYRKSPIEVDLNEASNMIDPDSLVLTSGINKKLELMGQKVNMALAYQFHYLFSEEIVKSANMEDGTAGNKIGSPGFETGGNVHVVSFGLNWTI